MKRYTAFIVLSVCTVLFVAPRAYADNYGTINYGTTGIYDTSMVYNIVQITWNPNDDEAQCWGSEPWSRDGEWIVYQAEIGGGSSTNNEICIMRPDGTDWLRLTYNSVCDSHPSFTPDGEHIVFQRYNDDRDHADIWIMDIDGSNQIDLTQQHVGEGPLAMNNCENKPLVSPDGSMISFHSCDEDIWVMNIDGTDPVQVSGDDIYECSKHQWSPDSDWIVFGGKSPVTVNSKIFKVRPDGSGLTMLSEDVDDVCDNWPEWSPNGKWISFHRRDQRGTWDLHSINIMTPDGEVVETFAQEYDDGVGWDQACGPTSWNKRSDRLVFKKEHSNNRRSVFLIDLDSYTTYQLTTNYYDYRAWLSPDGTQVLVKDRGNTTRDGSTRGYDLLMINLTAPAVEDEDEELSYIDELMKKYYSMSTREEKSEGENTFLGIPCFITAAAGQSNALFPLLLAAFTAGGVIIRKRMSR